MSTKRNVPAMAVRTASLGLIIATGISLNACQTSGDGPSFFSSAVDDLVTGSTSTQSMSVQDTTNLARQWEANPQDAGIALRYANSLTAFGSNDLAANVLRQAATHNPQNQQVLAAYGKALGTIGQYEEASQVLYKAIALGGADWRLYSAQGTVLDRMRQHERAQQYYEAALKSAPNETALNNNLAMSHALSGSPDEAETILRNALGRTGDASTKTMLNQNLALVLGLQGKFDEAQRVLATELPPEQVAANIAYIRQMVSQPDRWRQLQELEGTANPAAGG